MMIDCFPRHVSRCQRGPCCYYRWSDEEFPTPWLEDMLGDWTQEPYQCSVAIWFVEVKKTYALWGLTKFIVLCDGQARFWMVVRITRAYVPCFRGEM